MDRRAQGDERFLLVVVGVAWAHAEPAAFPPDVVAMQLHQDAFCVRRSALRVPDQLALGVGCGRIAPGGALSQILKSQDF